MDRARATRANAKNAASDHDVAAALIVRQRKAGRSVDKMQLQKLLYLVMGAQYALWGERAFRESPFAYARGPVFRNVEQTYRDGPQEIAVPLGGDPAKLSPALSDTVDLVLRYFGQWTALALERFCKRTGSPWRAVWQQPPHPTNNEIPDDLVMRWFRSHGVGPNPPRLDSELVATASTGNLDAINKLLG